MDRFLRFDQDNRHVFEVLDDFEDEMVAIEGGAARIRRSRRFLTRIGLDQWDDIDFPQRKSPIASTILRPLQ